MADAPETPAAVEDDKLTAPSGEAVAALNIKQTASDPQKPTMQVKVYAPFRVYFEGSAYSVSAVNATGPFDILPHHRNFLCMLVPCTLKLVTPYDEKPILVKLNRALMHVKADYVAVFVDV